MKDKRGKGRYLAQFHRRLKRGEVGWLEPYRTVARDLARRAEWGSLTLSGLDLGAAIDGQHRGLPGIGRRTLPTVVVQILNQKQMKLNDDRRPDHQPAKQSTFRKTRRQTRSKA